MPRLFLFTMEYPFGKGENFLEQEVPFLVDHFDEMTIVPVREARSRNPPRALPAGVRLDMGLADRSEQSHARDDLWFRLSSGAAEMSRRPHKLSSLQAVRRLWFYLRNAAQVRKWARERGLDRPVDDLVLYTYWLGGTTYGLTTLRGKRTTVVSRAHSGDLYEDKHPSGYLPLQRKTILRLDRLFPVSCHGRDHLARMWPETEARIEVARLGVPDPRHTTPSSSDDRLRIVSCSHITPVKRLPLIMNGIDHYARRHPERPVEWRHLGDGPTRERLAETADRVFPRNVDCRFLGRLPPGGIIDFYRTHPADIFINASSAEGVPVSIMEAQSCGIPVIATDVGGTSEIVNDDNGHLLSPTPTPEEIASAITAVEKDGAARRTSSKETWRTMSRAEQAYPDFAKRIKSLRA